MNSNVDLFQDDTQFPDTYFGVDIALDTLRNILDEAVPNTPQSLSNTEGEDRDRDRDRERDRISFTRTVRRRTISDTPFEFPALTPFAFGSSIDDPPINVNRFIFTTRRDSSSIQSPQPQQQQQPSPPPPPPPPPRPVISTAIEPDEVTLSIDTIVQGLKEARQDHHNLKEIEAEYAHRIDILTKAFDRLHNEITIFSTLTNPSEISDQMPIDYTQMRANVIESYRNSLEELHKELDEKTKDKELIEHRIEAFRKLVLTGLKEFVDPAQITRHVCPVCFDSEVNTVLYPCGHTLCSKCCVRVRECPVCKAVTQGRTRLYFSV